jgi:hypothetical protein
MGKTEEISRAFEGAYKTTKVDRFVQVRSRCLYPDGHQAELYIPEHDPRLVLDMGETMQWLKQRSEPFEREERERYMIREICLSRNIQFVHGMFLTRVSRIEDLPRGVDRLARATVWLAEMWVNGTRQDEAGRSRRA